MSATAPSSVSDIPRGYWRLQPAGLTLLVHRRGAWAGLFLTLMVLAIALGSLSSGTLPLAETGAVDTVPAQGTFELKDPKILVPGDPARSLVLFRMERLGLGRMPHIASNVVDRRGVELIRTWIKQLEKPPNRPPAK